MEHVPSRSLSELIRDVGPAGPGRGRRHRGPGRRRAGRGARGGDHAPRRQAGQRAGPRRRSREDQRLRHRPHRRRPDPDPVGARHRAPRRTSPPSWREVLRPDQASDVWALGATLYAAVEGRPPYRAQQNAVAVLHEIATEPPPPPTRADFLEPALQPDARPRPGLALVDGRRRPRAAPPGARARAREHPHADPRVRHRPPCRADAGADADRDADADADSDSADRPAPPLRRTATTATDAGRRCGLRASPPWPTVAAAPWGLRRRHRASLSCWSPEGSAGS